jgi:hypothetical protein
MKIKLFWGNPIVIVLVSFIFSVILMGISIVTIINGQAFEGKYTLFTVFVTFYNCITLIAFYIGYRLEIKKSKHAFMSPKKYKEAVKSGGQYESTLHRLKNSLRQMDVSIDQLDDDDIIDKAVEIIVSKDAKSI